MSVVESISHPLVSEVSEARDSVHMQYTMDGCENMVQYIYDDKSVSNSRAFFTAKPPLGSIVDRQILIEVTVEASITGTTASRPSFGDYFAPKAAPLNRMINTAQVNVNSQAIMSEPARVVDVFLRDRTNQESIKRFKSLSPMEPDYLNRYEAMHLSKSYRALNSQNTTDANGVGVAIPSLVAQTFTGTRADVYGASDPPTRADSNNAASKVVTVTSATGQDFIEFASPFRHAQYANDDYEPRASFPYTEKALVDAAGGGNTTITRTYTFTEVLLNPFCYVRSGKAAAHVTSLDVNLQFGSNLERIFSQIRAVSQRNYTAGAYTDSWRGAGVDHLDVTQGAGFSVKVTGAKMILKYATPSVQISPRQTLSLNHFRLNTQSIGTATASAWGGSDEITVDFNAIRLSVIPSHCYIFAKPKIDTVRPYNADAFLNISKVNVQISNRTGILSNMLEQELWNMSSENGIALSYPQWNQKVGSVLKLGFGKDLCGVLAGAREYIDFAFKITMKNTTYFDHSGITTGSINWGVSGTYNTKLLDRTTVDQSLDWELCVLFVTPQQLTLEDQVGTLEMGFSVDEVQDSMQYGMSSESIEDMNQIVGSGFGDWLKRGYHKAHHLVKKYARPVEQVLRSAEHVPGLGGLAGPAADIADQLAKSVGTGMKGRLALTRGRGKMY